MISCLKPWSSAASVADQGPHHSDWIGDILISIAITRSATASASSLRILETGRRIVEVLWSIFVIVGVYEQPSSPTEAYMKFLVKLRRYLVPNIVYLVMVMQDFNSKYSVWMPPKID